MKKSKPSYKPRGGAMSAFKPVGKPSKYSAQRTIVAGVTFDSKKEAGRYMELQLLERGGAITNLRLQPSIRLTAGGRPVRYLTKEGAAGRQAVYRADFSYTDTRTGETIFEDVKGMDTPASKLKRAIVLAETGIDVKLI